MPPQPVDQSSQRAVFAQTSMSIPLIPQVVVTLESTFVTGSQEMISSKE